MKRIAVVGLGQIGGSIVLALRKNKAPYRITGIDLSTKRLGLLESSLDDASTSWSASANADLVVLCLHYDSTREFLQSTDPLQRITDVCSGKRKLLQLANRRKLRFIGGHPLAGNEFAGEKGWRNDLFENAPYFLCPSNKTLRSDQTELRKFVRFLRARPILVDPEKHDRYLATTSHFPAFLSGMLAAMAAGIPEEFQGPGFRSMTRLAATDQRLLQTFLESNGGNVVRSANKLQKLLEQFFSRQKPSLTAC